MKNKKAEISQLVRVLLWIIFLIIGLTVVYGLIKYLTNV